MRPIHGSIFTQSLIQTGSNTSVPNRPSQISKQHPLPSQTDVVIVGGGVVGICTALMLARAGVRCVVLEKGRVGAEQSTRNWGWIRMQGRSPAEVPLMKLSQQLWRELDSQAGKAFGFRQIGCTYLATNEEQLEQRLQFMQTARDFDLGTVALNARQVATKFGNSLAIPCIGAIHTSTDCCAEPALAMRALTAMAQQAGAEIFEHCAVRTLDHTNGVVGGVVSEHGRISCERVLLAAGAWSRTFMENDGLALPQLAVKSSVFRTAPVNLPFTSAMATNDVAIRPRADGGVTVGKASASSFQIVPAAFTHFRSFYPLLKNGSRTTTLRIGRDFFGPLGRSRWRADQQSPFERNRILDPTPDTAMIDAMSRHARTSFEGLSNLRIAEQWAGMIDVTPDELPVVDEIKNRQGLFIATGFSGHGFGLGPGAGALACSLIMGKTPVVDPGAFKFDRFSQGAW